MCEQICLLGAHWPEKPLQNLGIWLSLWNASLRHRSLFTVLIKWKVWNNWGEWHFDLCIMCGGEGLGNGICSCNDVFDTPWLVNASSKLSLNREEDLPWECLLCWLFWPFPPPLPPLLIFSEDLWGWKGWEMGGRRLLRKGWRGFRALVEDIRGSEKNRTRHCVLKKGWIKVASVCILIIRSVVVFHHSSFLLRFLPFSLSSLPLSFFLPFFPSLPSSPSSLPVYLPLYELWVGCFESGLKGLIFLSLDTFIWDSCLPCPLLHYFFISEWIISYNVKQFGVKVK